MPDFYIIAGPNGAGKTTAAFTVLPEVLNIKEFINADEIARGISPFNVESVAIQAGKIMLERIDFLISKSDSFAVETTLSSVVYLKKIMKAKTSGYNTTLFYVWLNSWQLAKERVANRVSKGGHNIPDDVVERRYYKGLKNLHQFMNVVDDWYLYDNSESYYQPIAKSINGELNILSFEKYNKLVQ